MLNILRMYPLKKKNARTSQHIFGCTGLLIIVTFYYFCA